MKQLQSDQVEARAHRISRKIPLVTIVYEASFYGALEEDCVLFQAFLPYCLRRRSYGEWQNSQLTNEICQLGPVVSARDTRE